MVENDGKPEQDETGAAKSGDELAGTAARLLKAAGPKVTRFIDEARPKLEKAGRDAVDYARDHRDELRTAAAGLARSRLTGPLGMVIDSLTPTRPVPAAAVLTCPSCANANPAGSKFCNQCGSALGPDSALTGPS